MKYVSFLFFVLISIGYIWSGKDVFVRKDWIKFGQHFISVAIAITIVGFIIKGSLAVFPEFSRSTARFILAGFSLSSIMVLGLKFLVVMMCAIFARIMKFHQVKNQNNYNNLSVFTSGISLPMLNFFKLLLSAVGVIIFYGIWLAQP
ncbi:hypothetical protein [Erwinia sp. 198]|uniref:hypothetical protein n=1 Tax=Erwinia sp. 198 TaxID=2022746 RepID=UPI000F665C36|nr:hypothetical protein [Erwinia sp. 198]RRZ88106.1 hypothetical protein EGK14_18115 [Erwinia sp. 198]